MIENWITNRPAERPATNAGRSADFPTPFYTWGEQEIYLYVADFCPQDKIRHIRTGSTALPKAKRAFS
jgi:hypothetical protein